MKKLDAILYILRSRNFILIHSIKEREVLGVSHKNVKILRHTNYTIYEDAEIIGHAHKKIKEKINSIE